MEEVPTRTVVLRLSRCAGCGRRGVGLVEEGAARCRACLAAEPPPPSPPPGGDGGSQQQQQQEPYNAPAYRQPPQAAQPPPGYAHANANANAATRPQRPDNTASSAVADAASLYHASQTGELEAVRELLARGANVDARLHPSGGTALVASSERGHAAVIRELLARGADVNARHNSDMTALHFASSHGRAEAVRALLAHADVDAHALDKAGRSALHLAERRVARDAAPPTAGTAQLTAAERAEHALAVELLRAHIAAHAPPADNAN